jgi:hypothetical protein
MKNVILFLVIIILSGGYLFADRYYVDPDGGFDGNSGKSETAAWQSLAKVNSPNPPFKTNDTISFKCGTRITGQTLIPPSSYLLFNSYDSGARPVIDGESQIYCVDLSPSQTDQNPRSHLKFVGIKFVNGTPDNITLWNCPYITIDSCNIDSSKGNNIQDCGIYAGYQCSNLKVTNSTISYGEQGTTTNQGNLGIYIDGCDNCLIEHDTLIGNFSNVRVAFGDDLGMANGLVVKYCILRNPKFDNVDDDGSYGAQFYYNLMESSNINTYFFTDSQGANEAQATQNSEYYNNTFITTGTEASIHLNSVSTGVNNGMVFKNNNFYLSNYGYFFDEQRNGQMGSWTFTNNQYFYNWPEDTHNPHLWVKYPDTLSALAQWQALGYDANSHYGDPMFTNYGGADYSLQNISPAALAGVNVGLTNDILFIILSHILQIILFQNRNHAVSLVNSRQASLQFMVIRFPIPITVRKK